MVFEDEGHAVEIRVARAQKAAGKVGEVETGGKRLVASADQREASPGIRSEVDGGVAGRDAVGAQIRRLVLNRPPHTTPACPPDLFSQGEPLYARNHRVQEPSCPGGSSTAHR